MAAFWAGAAHPRRQKHREMPPPGASAPAFAATVKHARACPHAKPCFGARWNACRGMCYFLHRFLISSPDLRIDASFSLETSFCLHRFLISGPNLRIDAGFSPFKPSSVHRFLISSPNLRIDARFRCRIRIINDVRVRFQSLLRREEWSACSGCGGNEFRIRF